MLQNLEKTCHETTCILPYKCKINSNLVEKNPIYYNRKVLLVIKYLKVSLVMKEYNKHIL